MELGGRTRKPRGQLHIGRQKDNRAATKNIAPETGKAAILRGAARLRHSVDGRIAVMLRVFALVLMSGWAAGAQGAEQTFVADEGQITSICPPAMLVASIRRKVERRSTCRKAAGPNCNATGRRRSISAFSCARPARRNSTRMSAMSAAAAPTISCAMETAGRRTGSAAGRRRPD